MKSKGFLLDTNIVIALFSNDPIVSSFVKKAVENRSPLLCSVITECAVLSKMTELEYQKAKLFNAKHCLEVSREIAKMAGQLQGNKRNRGENCKTPDAIIIATAWSQNLPLVSRDHDMAFVEKELGIPLINLKNEDS